MKLKDYLKFAKSTAVYPKIIVLKNPCFDQIRKCQNVGVELENITWVYPLIGLLGEVGELANKLKKVIRDNNFVITSEIKKILIDEKGDVSWYDIILDDELGIDPDKKLDLNKIKLTQRKKTNTIHHTKKRDNQESKLSTFMNIMKKLEGKDRKYVDEKTLINKLRNSGKFTNLYDIKQYIKLMLSQAVIYESKPGRYNTV